MGRALRVQPGAWYGFPDFATDVPVTDPQFKPRDQPQPQFLIADHPTEKPPAPIAKFGPHEATNGFAFAANSDWGKPTDAFVALFGDFTPATGTVDLPVLQPLITERGFPPQCYAISFVVFGLVLGLLLAYVGRKRQAPTDRPV